MTRINRRQALLRGLAGGAGLTALATGLPTSFLRSRSTAYAQSSAPTYFVLAASNDGDPVNANTPGSYVDGVINNPLDEMAPVDFRLGSVSTRGARPWSTLSEDLRARLAFLHMATDVVTHGQMDEVLQLRGSVIGRDGSRLEMLPSAIAEEAADVLETTITEPIPLSDERLFSRGLPLDNIGPVELKNLFSVEQRPLTQLAERRDAALDALAADLRSNGTQAQRAFLDRYALGRTQARALGEQLATLLERIVDNPLDEVAVAENEIVAAVALFRLNVTPVVAIQLPFGADNHQDSDLGEEADQYQDGVALIQLLWDELKAADLADRTTFAMLNVFGRTLLRNSAGGRDHNENHHTLVTFGPAIEPGVYGGLIPVDNGFGAAPIDPASGRPTSDGGINRETSLLATGRTLMRAIGLADEVAQQRLTGGTVISGMLRDV